MRKPLNERGQALVEYMLMIAVAFSIVIVFTTTLRSSVLRLWGYYIQQITAACPGCPPDPRYKM